MPLPCFLLVSFNIVPWGSLSEIFSAGNTRNETKGKKSSQWTWKLLNSKLTLATIVLSTDCQDRQLQSCGQSFYEYLISERKELLTVWLQFLSCSHVDLWFGHHASLTKRKKPNAAYFSPPPCFFVYVRFIASLKHSNNPTYFFQQSSRNDF